MFYVYVLYSDKFNRTYKGMTMDVDKRLSQHNLKQNKSTKAYTPWRLIHKEGFETRIEARERKKYFKTGVGRAYIKNFITFE